MSVLDTGRAVVHIFRERNITLLAASFAYYAFVSVIPLLLLVLALGTALEGGSFVESVVAVASGTLSPSAVAVIRRTLSNASGQTSAGAVGLLALLWSASKVFRGLSVAFDEVYGTTADTGLLDQFRDAAVVLLAIVAAVAAMATVGVAVVYSLLPPIPYAGFVGGLALFVGLVVAGLPLYYVLPPVDVTAREVLPGALLTATGWLVLTTAFQAYARRADRFEAYGALGAALLFVTFLYFAGIVLFAGAAVNAVREGHGGNV